MLEKFFKKTVTVEFINIDTNQEFARSEIPVENLPKSFHAATTMHIKDEDWEVIKADPVESEQFIKTKSLQLFLRKNNIQNIDPKSILYSTSTIENQLPKISGVPVGSNTFTMHEDDWRQREFVSYNQKSSVDEELQKIKEIHENHSKKLENGLTVFKKIHVRNSLHQPLSEAKIIFNDLLSFFSVVEKKDISFQGYPGIIENGFYIKTNLGFEYYGIYDENHIIINFGMVTMKSLEGEINQNQLEEFLKKFQLIFLDWPNARIFTSFS